VYCLRTSFRAEIKREEAHGLAQGLAQGQELLLSAVFER